MNERLPANDRLRNAYHESGHVVIAWLFNPDSAGYVEIGDVVSRSRISTRGFTPLQHTCVAVAGSLAEVRGITGKRPTADLLQVSVQILQHGDRRLPGYGAQQLDIPVDGGGAEPASFSDDDFLLIHADHHGSANRIAEALQEAARMVESEFGSGRMSRLCQALLERGGLGGDTVRDLLP